MCTVLSGHQIGGCRARAHAPLRLLGAPGHRHLAGLWRGCAGVDWLLRVACMGLIPARTVPYLCIPDVSTQTVHESATLNQPARRPIGWAALGRCACLPFTPVWDRAAARDLEQRRAAWNRIAHPTMHPPTNSIDIAQAHPWDPCLWDFRSNNHWAPPTRAWDRSVFVYTSVQNPQRKPKRTCCNEMSRCARPGSTSGRGVKTSWSQTLRRDWNSAEGEAASIAR